jgi:hypothetical protein
MTDRGKPIAGFPRSLENAGAFPTFPPHDHYDSPSTKETNLRRYDRENRFHLTDADHLGHNRFTGVASLRARYRHRPESLSTSRRNALSTSPEYAFFDRVLGLWWSRSLCRTSQTLRLQASGSSDIMNPERNCSEPSVDLQVVDLPPFLTQPIKTQNPFKGELSHGVIA